MISKALRLQYIMYWTNADIGTPGIKKASYTGSDALLVFW